MATQIKPRPISLEKPKRDKNYREWLRRQPCEVCNTRRDVECAHTGTKGKGTGVKACDLDAIPLCEKCHRTGKDSYHAIGSELMWAARHCLDLVVVRVRLREKYLGRVA